jgi:hypothetical protein
MTNPNPSYEDLLHEVEFLRFYKIKVYPCLGPADSEIEDSIKKEYVEKFKRPLPARYADEDSLEIV